MNPKAMTAPMPPADVRKLLEDVRAGLIHRDYEDNAGHVTRRVEIYTAHLDALIKIAEASLPRPCDQHRWLNVGSTERGCIHCGTIEPLPQEDQP